MKFLRQSTQVKIDIGLILDKADGVTPVSGLLLTDIWNTNLLKHNGGTVVDLTGRTWADTVGIAGMYRLTLTAADVDTLGLVTVIFQDDWYLCPVRQDYMVLNKNYYDSKFNSKLLRIEPLAQKG